MAILGVVLQGKAGGGLSIDERRLLRLQRAMAEVAQRRRDATWFGSWTDG
jgi:hypothetical protein